MTYQQIEERSNAWLQNGLQPDFAIRTAILELLGGQFGYRLNPTSGFRSVDYQRSLYERWRMGDRSIVVKPASRSWHSSGRAVDFSGSSQHDLNTAGRIAPFLGLRWGGSFLRPDVVHFDMPGQELPEKAY